MISLFLQFLKTFVFILKILTEVYQRLESIEQSECVQFFGEEAKSGEPKLVEESGMGYRRWQNYRKMHEV